MAGLSRGVAALSMLALSAALPVPVLADTEGAPGGMKVERTDPNHVRAPFRGYEPQDFIEPRVRRVESQAVYSLPDGLTGLVTLDKTLSRLCQRGAFGQKIDGFYWARTKDRRYGVAFSGGANLLDPQNKRQPGKAYFIDGQDSRCSVYVGDQDKLARHYVGP